MPPLASHKSGPPLNKLWELNVILVPNPIDNLLPPIPYTKIPLKKFAILLGSVLLSLTFYLFIPVTLINPASGAAPDEGASADILEKIIADQNKALLLEQKQQELHRALQAYFDKAIASGDIVGAGVSIVKGNSILLSEGFGKRNVDTDAEVNGETVFRLGSLSKGFAGILAAQLNEEGKLDWEDKVIDYIPEFQLGDRNNTAQITLAHILSHSSGTPYHCYTNLVESGMPLQDIAARFGKVTPISKPGALYSYQNAMFALSAEMMQKATGKDISMQLNERFFEPLEMVTTTMDHKALTASENVALPHSKRGHRWKSLKLSDSYYNAVVAGGINASALDMAKWMRFLLGYHPEIMDKSALHEAFYPFIEIKGHSKYYHRWPGHLSSYYGFGWRIHKFTGDDNNEEITVWHHGGSVNNYRNEIAIYPDDDLGICVLLNSNSKLSRTVIPELHRIVKEVYSQTPSILAQQ